jgi:hypothetical protein
VVEIVERQAEEMTSRVEDQFTELSKLVIDGGAS